MPSERNNMKIAAEILSKALPSFILQDIAQALSAKDAVRGNALVEALRECASLLESYNLPQLREVFESERQSVCDRAFTLLAQYPEVDEPDDDYAISCRGKR